MSDGQMPPSSATGMRSALAAEDLARADFYALLSRLFSAAPDAGLLAAIASAPQLEAVHSVDDEVPPPGLPVAWDALRAASAAMDADAARDEYDNLFVGVGKCEVNLHGSHWLTGFMMEKPLADVRATLATLGLGRRDGVNLVEDHVAALFETMRILIAGKGDRAPASVAQQKAFFDRHIAAWISECCTAIQQSSIANYYRWVAQFTDCYMAVERDSLAME
jgi:TorA maturation chaperone TorD